MQPSRDILESLFERAPRFIERLSGESFESYEALIDHAERIAAYMPVDEQIELLNAHPRIGARPSTVSTMSFREQGYDRDAGTDELQQRLDRLNENYERRFGFRFVIFVVGRPRSEIADIFEARMSAPREEERRRGLSDVFAIARDRLQKLELAHQEAR